MLLEPVERRRRARAFIRRNLLSIQDSRDEWRQQYQFYPEDIDRLVFEFGLGESIVEPREGHRAPSRDVLTWLLYRYVGGHTLLTCQTHFGVCRRTMGALVAALETHLGDRCVMALSSFNFDLLTRAKLDEYAAALEDHGCPTANVW